MTKELPIEFTGRAEVKGFHFKQIAASRMAYLYEVTDEGLVQFEVFERHVNERFDVVSYPKSSAFGLWAWTYRNLEQAYERYKQLTGTGFFMLQNQESATNAPRVGRYIRYNKLININAI